MIHACERVKPSFRDRVGEKQWVAGVHEGKIAEYRAAAAACMARAVGDPNKSTAARWLKVAEEWTRMADELERRMNPPDSGN